MSGVKSYEGVLAGLERGLGEDGCWAFEGVSYETPADEGDVLATVCEALEEPGESEVAAARRLVFGCGNTYTAQALLAMAAAYDAEVGEGDAVAAMLRAVARRVAVVEALTV